MANNFSVMLYHSTTIFYVYFFYRYDIIVFILLVTLITLVYQIEILQIPIQISGSINHYLESS